MNINFTRDEALALLKKYNKEKFHIEHALTLEGVMGWYARELGYGEEEQFWRMAGLLHDIDFEVYPAEHCKKAPELLAELNASDALVHAVCSHAFGQCCDVEPVHQMEKVMFAVDELTGLIGAAARMRPSKSVMEMELSTTGGLAEQIKRIVAAQDQPAIIKIFKELILKAYGEKSADGKRFVKSDEIATAFSQTEAYSILFMELATDADAAAKFVNGIVPADAAQKAQAALAAGNV